MSCVSNTYAKLAFPSAKRSSAHEAAFPMSKSASCDINSSSGLNVISLSAHCFAESNLTTTFSKNKLLGMIAWSAKTFCKYVENGRTARKIEIVQIEATRIKTVRRVGLCEAENG